MITIALAKGRLWEESLPLLEKVGAILGEGNAYLPSQSPNNTRALIIPANKAGVQFLILRSSDVPTFVRHGAAQIGFAGSDILMEQEAADIFQPYDLPIGHCRLSLAMPQNLADKWHNDFNNINNLRVATKYPLLAYKWFAEKRQNVQLIKLYGSMEIAPLVGVADAIVDLVSSGATLRENKLVEVATIAQINAKLIVGRSNLKTEQKILKPLLNAFAQIL